jgi:hypothetical protein
MIYRTEVYSKKTGELIYTKKYTELFPVEKNVVIGRMWKMLYYCAARFGISRSELYLMSEKKEGGDKYVIIHSM